MPFFSQRPSSFWCPHPFCPDSSGLVSVSTWRCLCPARCWQIVHLQSEAFENVHMHTAKAKLQASFWRILFTYMFHNALWSAFRTVLRAVHLWSDHPGCMQAHKPGWVPQSIELSYFHFAIIKMEEKNTATEQKESETDIQCLKVWKTFKPNFLGHNSAFSCNLWQHTNTSAAHRADFPLCCCQSEGTIKLCRWIHCTLIWLRNLSFKDSAIR